VAGLGGFCVSARSGQVEGAWIEPDTSLESACEGLVDFLDPDTLRALSRSSDAVAKRRLEPGEYDEDARDELVEWMASEGWLNETLLLHHHVQKHAALIVAAKRLFVEVAKTHERGPELVEAALEYAISEQTTVPTSKEVGAHAILALAKAAETDADAVEELLVVFLRAEMLARAMIAEA
jgi:hypothetical protein